MNCEQGLTGTYRTVLTWETISDHQDSDRLVSGALILDKRQVVLNDLSEFRTSRGVIAWKVELGYIALHAYERHIPSGRIRLNKAVTSALDYMANIPINVLVKREKMITCMFGA